MSYTLAPYLSTDNQLNPKELIDALYLHHGSQFQTFIDVMKLSYVISYEMTHSKIYSLLAGKSGLFHDIGKIGLPSNYGGGKVFTNDMRQEMRKHPEGGALLLEQAGAEPEVIQAARYHQENADGTGYPRGVRGSDIPVMAQIVQVADSVNAALDTSRTYKEALHLNDLENDIISKVHRCYHPAPVQAFLVAHRRVLSFLRNQNTSEQIYYLTLDNLYGVSYALKEDELLRYAMYYANEPTTV